MFCTFWLDNALFATAACNFSTSELQKVPKCVFRHSGAKNFRHLNFKKCSETDVFCTFWLHNVLFATAACNFSTSELQKAPSTSCFVHFHVQMCFFTTAACNFSTSELQKVLRAPHVLCIFTSKCAFHHSGVQFFDIWTSKSAPSTSCFVHFHVQMCFSPQRRAIFDSAPAALTGLLFDWPDTQILEKTQHFGTSLTFGADVSSFFWLSRYCIFFLLTWLR